MEEQPPFPSLPPLLRRWKVDKSETGDGPFGSKLSSPRPGAPECGEGAGGSWKKWDSLQAHLLAYQG